jgi:hypothetical protein
MVITAGCRQTGIALDWSNFWIHNYGPSRDSVQIEALSA